VGKKAEGNGIKQVNPYLLSVQRSQSSKLKPHMKKKNEGQHTSKTGDENAAENQSKLDTRKICQV